MLRLVWRLPVLLRTYDPPEEEDSDGRGLSHNGYCFRYKVSISCCLISSHYLNGSEQCVMCQKYKWITYKYYLFNLVFTHHHFINAFLLFFCFLSEFLLLDAFSSKSQNRFAYYIIFGFLSRTITNKKKWTQICKSFGPVLIQFK